MRRLLWKEWRERALWLLLMLAAIVCTTVFTRGSYFLGSPVGLINSPWIMPPFLLALLAGLGSYGSELQGERATFLYSRAVTWKQVLVAKLAPGVLAGVLGVGLSIYISLHMLPKIYLAFATQGNILAGAGMMLALALGGFLLGFGFSIALPGMGGSILTGLLWLGTLVVQLYAWQHSRSGTESAFAVFLTMGAVPLAAVTVARFGLTLKAPARVARFFLVLLLIIALGTSFAVSPRGNTIVRRLVNSFAYAGMAVSPDGKYGFVTRADEEQDFIIDLTSGRRFRVPHRSAYLPEWVTSTCLSYTGMGGGDDAEFYFVLHDGRVKTLKSSPIVGYDGVGKVEVVSPDGSRILSIDHESLRMFDLRLARETILAQVPAGKVEAPAFRNCWWQSDNEVGYLDPLTGKRVIVPIGGG